MKASVLSESVLYSFTFCANAARAWGTAVRSIAAHRCSRLPTPCRRRHRNVRRNRIQKLFAPAECSEGRRRFTCGASEAPAGRREAAHLDGQFDLALEKRGCAKSGRICDRRESVVM
eukprot:Polyplicarium_translucidae@DN775_c0_g1_i1.p2